MALKNQNGFAMALLTALLPILLAVFLAVFAVLAFLQIDQKLQYACRSEGLKGQQQTAPLLQALLKLNPLAKSLQIKMTAAKVKLAAAVAHANAAAINAAQAEILRIHRQKQQLDIRQKQLLTQSNLLLSQAYFQGQRRLRESAKSLNDFSALFVQSSRVVAGTPPKLAVRPDSPDLAPTYSLLENFDARQALAHSWHYHLALLPRLQGFITGNLAFEKSCAVTLKEDNSQWVPKIKKVKS